MTPYLLLVLFTLCAALAVAAASGPAGSTPSSRRASPRTDPSVDWHARYLAEHKLAARRLRGWDHANRRIVRLRLGLLHRGSTAEALELACATYGHCSTLWRKARCESHLYRFARNGSGASGLFQFLPSTWRSTPYAGSSIWSAYAQALAAGWMHAHGRGGEWVCR